MEQTTVGNETVFTYQHGSGELVSVRSFEEALGRCAFLATESETSPEEARMWFDLHARGMEADASEEIAESDEEEAEVNEEPEPELPQETKKAEQKTRGAERTERRTSDKEVPDIPSPIKQITSQETISAPAKAAAVNKSFGAKPAPSRAGETASEPPPASTISVSSPQKVKAETYSIPEMPQNIVKAVLPITETRVASGAEETETVQETPGLSNQDLAKNTYLSGDQQVAERVKPPGATLSPEINNEPSLIEQNQEILSVEIEEQVATAETDTAFFLKEIADPEAEIFLENELIGADEQWANDEVVRLREFGSEEESSTTSVLFAEINKPEATEDLPAEEVEQTIIDLVERIEAIDTEGAEMVYGILDKIALKVETIIIPLQVAESGQENDESGQVNLGVVEIEAKPEEELRGLFIELFVYVGMEYSPELIEAITKLALKLDIRELSPKTELMEKSVPDPSQGTHEIIKQLLGALTAIKQAAERAYAIGKSILLLYRLESAIT